MGEKKKWIFPKMWKNTDTRVTFEGTEEEYKRHLKVRTKQKRFDLLIFLGLLLFFILRELLSGG